MSTTKSPRTICLPAHILDAHVSPRAREVLMLLASQTTAQSPTVWVCHAAIAEKLRCSSVTVKRAIQKLVEAKLIDETGDLHERKYKFYRVKWSLNEQPLAKVVAPKKRKLTPELQHSSLPSNTSSLRAQRGDPEVLDCHGPHPEGFRTRTDEPIPPPRPNLIPTADQLLMLKDPTLAHYAEVAHQRHLDYLRRYNIDPSSFR